MFAADFNPLMAPACHEADGAFAVPRVTSAGYVDTLKDICLRNDVGLVVPTIDTELSVLAEHRDEFEREGIAVMVSDLDFVSVCRDKRRTMALFDRLGVRNPETRDKNRPVFPMFAKPYDGSLSCNIHVLRSEADLTEEIMNDPKLMFMEYIDKREYGEFTVDMYYGKDGRVKAIVPRERIEVRSGEVNKGATRKNYIVDYLRRRMGRMPGVRGCICVQLFYRERGNDIASIEINPRYGGGYPLSYYAGANFPALMVREYILGEDVDYDESWEDGVLMLRYDAQVIVR